MIIAIDIDGTLRDLETQIRKYLEEDYPEHIEDFDNNVGKVYRTLNPLIGEFEAMKWLYEERPMELFAMAPRVHRSIIEDLNKFAQAAENQGHKVVIASVQRDKSIMATTHWLSKMGCKVKHYDFFDTMQDKIDYNYDVYVDDCPEVLNACEIGWEPRKMANRNPIGIKVPYDFNKNIECPVLDIKKGKFNDIYNILNIERGF